MEFFFFEVNPRRIGNGIILPREHEYLVEATITRGTRILGKHSYLISVDGHNEVMLTEL